MSIKPPGHALTGVSFCRGRGGGAMEPMFSSIILTLSVLLHLILTKKCIVK